MITRFRVGTKVARHVYEGDEPLFTAASAEQAARLVDLLNLGSSNDELYEMLVSVHADLTTAILESEENNQYWFGIVAEIQKNIDAVLRGHGSPNERAAAQYAMLLEEQITTLRNALARITTYEHADMDADYILGTVRGWAQDALKGDVSEGCSGEPLADGTPRCGDISCACHGGD